MKKTFGNIILNSLYQVFIILIPIITIPYVSRVIGPASLGINSYYTAISLFLGYFILMGIAQLGPKEISQANIDERNTTFFELWSIQVLSGIVVLIGYLISILFSKNSFFLTLQIPYLLSVILDISWFYIGIQEMKTVIARNVFIKCLSLILIFIFVKHSKDLWIYMLINSTSTLLSNLFFWIGLKKNLNNEKSIGFKIFFGKKYFRNALILLIPQMAAQMYTTVDKIVVNHFTSETELSFYDQSQKMARIILAIITSISVVLMPVIAKYDNENNQKSIVKVLKLSLDIMCSSSFLFMYVLILNSESFVPWFFGSSFSPMVKNMQIASLIILPISIGSVFSNQFALAKGYYKAYSIPYIVGAIFNPILNIVLVPIFHSVGASISLLITECMVCILRIFLVRKNLNLKYFLSDYSRLFITFIFSLFIGNFIYLELKSAILTILINGFIELILFIVLIFAFNRPFFIRNREIISGFLKK